MSLSLPDESRCKRVAAIRWLAVFKHTTLGLTAREVTEHLHVSDTSQKRWLSTFKKTGDVFPPKRGAQGRPRALSKDEEFDLVTRVLDSPTTTLGKQHALIYLASGERVSLKTLCCTRTTCAASVYSTSLLGATRIERKPGSRRW